MKKSKLILLVFIFFFRVLSAQNLVVNGSLESFSPCPFDVTTSNINKANGWWTINGTCDLYNTCSSDTNLQVPDNTMGWQMARTGSTYGGAGMFFASMIYPDGHQNVGMEALGVSLSQTLTANVTYNIRCYISRTDDYPGVLQPSAIDSFGFYFCQSQFTFQYHYTQNPDAVDTSGVYCDTTNWIEINAQYTATGNEQYIALGSFKKSGNPVYYTCGQAQLQWAKSYYYIDDVALWPADTVPPPADAGPDTTICRGGKARLGTHNYSDYIYEWWPAATLSNDSGGVVWASPDTTTTYYLQATDDIFTKTMDSVTVFVNNCGQNDTVVCVEQQFVMGSTNNPLWNYQWSPSTWLSSDTVGMPLCNPMANQNYQLLITNAAGDTIALDSTNLIVGSCYYAQAGNDSLICKGDSLQIGMQQYSFVDYVWSPNYMISDTSIGNPMVWPDTITWYYLQLTDTMGNISYDSVLVDVQICLGLEAAKPLDEQVMVYPNPAQDLFNIEMRNKEILISKISITNLLGQKVYDKYFGNNYKVSINTSSFEKGIYLIKVIGNNNSYQTKLIIQ